MRYLSDMGPEGGYLSEMGPEGGYLCDAGPGKDLRVTRKLREDICVMRDLSKTSE